MAGNSLSSLSCFLLNGILPIWELFATLQFSNFYSVSPFTLYYFRCWSPDAVGVWVYLPILGNSWRFRYLVLLNFGFFLLLSWLVCVVFRRVLKRFRNYPVDVIIPLNSGYLLTLLMVPFVVRKFEICMHELWMISQVMICLSQEYPATQVEHGEDSLVTSPCQLQVPCIFISSPKNLPRIF